MSESQRPTIFSLIYATRKTSMKDELYDLIDDPLMVRNLIDAAAPQTVRRQMDARLGQLFRATHGR